MIIESNPAKQNGRRRKRTERLSKQIIAQIINQESHLKQKRYYEYPDAKQCGLRHTISFPDWSIEESELGPGAIGSAVTSG